MDFDRLIELDSKTSWFSKYNPSKLEGLKIETLGVVIIEFTQKTETFSKISP